jgi:hypothetical protein
MMEKYNHAKWLQNSCVYSIIMKRFCVRLLGRAERNLMKNIKEKRMQWHPACFAALNLEFAENKDDLEFLQEQAVNELPLRIDALII